MLSDVSYSFVFIVCPSQGLTRHIKTKVLTTFTSCKAFQQNKSGTSLPASLSA